MQPLYHHYPMLDAFSLSVVSCMANSVPKFKQVSTIHVSVIRYSSIIMIIACTGTTCLYCTLFWNSDRGGTLATYYCGSYLILLVSACILGVCCEAGQIA